MTVFKRFISDSKGKVVLWQTPNVSLTVWAVATVIGKFIHADMLHTLLGLLAFGSLFTWSWGEMFYGASPFRRVLGVVIMTVLLVNRLG